MLLFGKSQLNLLLYAKSDVRKWKYMDQEDKYDFQVSNVTY